MSTDPLALWRQVTWDLPLALALYDADGLLLAANPAADRMLAAGAGQPPDPLLPAPRMPLDGTDAVQVLLTLPDRQPAQEPDTPLLESERLHKAVLASMGDGMLVHDETGRVVTANEAACVLLGVTLDELTGRLPADAERRVVSQDGSELGADDYPVSTVLRTGEAVRDMTMGVHRPDGTLVWLAVSAVPLLEDGAVIGTVVTFHDVTQRVELTSTLALREQQLRRTFEDSPIGMLIASADPATGAVLTDANDAFCRMAGRTRDELLAGMRFVDLLHSGDRAAANELLAGLLRGEQTRDEPVERRMLRPDGSTVWIELITSLVRHVDGRPLHVLRQVEDVTERRASRKHIERLAHSDVLTGLPNRALVDQLLRQAQARAARTAEHLALLFIDLDRFKTVNDSLGHEVGDALLIALAERLWQHLGHDHRLGRQGGDEFLVLCEDLGTDEDEAYHRAAEAAASVHAALSAPVTVAGHELRMTASIGVALSCAGSRSPAELLRAADLAMYHAKARGRDRTEIFEESLEQLAARRAQVEHELRRGLADDQFELHLQPVVELATGRWVGAEALVRWRHPEHGLLLPGAFLSVAEDSGLIQPLGDWVIEAACRHLSALLAGGWAEASINLNVSGRQLGRHAIVEVVRRAVDRYGIDPRRLRMEITEDVLIELAGSPMHELHALHQLGTPVGLDDFGTGYSSLSHLRQLPVSFVKIDGSFVASLTDEAADHAIVAAVIGLAEDLGLDVVAEGVEDERAARTLIDLGCLEAQGWWYGPAMPLQEFADRRRRQARVPSAPAG